MFSDDLWLEITKVTEGQNSLQIVDFDDDNALIEGVFELSDAEGVFDGYDTRIAVSSSFPWDYPKVFETSGRIIRDADHHCMPGGYACLTSWPVWLAMSDDVSFSAVFNGPIKDWFLSQSIFERTGEWRYGEFSHGVYGQLEALCMFLQIDCPRAIVQKQDALKISIAINKGFLAMMKPPKGHHPCFCGSDRRFRDCHRSLINELNAKVPPDRKKRLLNHILWLSEKIKEMP